MLRIRPIRTIDDLHAISETWIRLFEASPNASIPQSLEWNLAWCDLVLPHRPREHMDIRLLEDEAGRAVSVLPLFSRRIGGPMMRMFQFLGHRMPVHHDILVVEPDNADLVRDIVVAMRSMLGGRGILHLRRLHEDSVLTRELLKQGLAYPQDAHIRVRADPDIIDQSSRFGKSTRKTYRWQLNKLQREHGIEYRVFGETDFDRAFEEHIRLHGLRWREKPGESFIQHEQRDFLQAVSSSLARQGRCEIIQLRAGPRMIGSSLRFLDRGGYYGISSGFDPEYAKYSPMRLLFTEAMRRGFDELGCSVVDFGPGYDLYKLDWKPEVATSYYCSFAGNSPYGRLLARVYRAAFARHLPPSHLNQSKSG